MIYLKYNIENTIAVTLWEIEKTFSATTATTIYQMSLYNSQDLKTTKYDLNDSSPNPIRYNEFKLTIDELLLSPGYYDYEFHLKDSNTGEIIGTLLESGKCLVETISNITTPYQKTDNIYVYKQ